MRRWCLIIASLFQVAAGEQPQQPSQNQPQTPLSGQGLLCECTAPQCSGLATASDSDRFRDNGAADSGVAASSKLAVGTDVGTTMGTAASANAPTPLSGDIEQYLKDITYGEADDELWMPVTQSDGEEMDALLSHLLAGASNQAAQIAQNLNFVLIEYTDPQRGLHYILRDPPTTANTSPRGTYVWKPQASLRAVVEVPHPRNDTRTSLQGIELFLRAEAALLLISGTHRRSDLVLSSCDNAESHDYRRSDPAHAIDHFFHIVHMHAEDNLDEPLFIQLHGFGDSAYKKLKKQCGHYPSSPDPKLLVNISDGFKDRSGDNSGAPHEGSFARLLADTVNADGSIKACLYNEDTSSYGGTLNVQGRYTNRSEDPCHTHAGANNGRFIHLEQSYNTRRYQRDLMNELIAEALASYFDE